MGSHDFFQNNRKWLARFKWTAHFCCSIKGYSNYHNKYSRPPTGDPCSGIAVTIQGLVEERKTKKHSDHFSHLKCFQWQLYFLFSDSSRHCSHQMTMARIWNHTRAKDLWGNKVSFESNIGPADEPATLGAKSSVKIQRLIYFWVNSLLVNANTLLRQRQFMGLLWLKKQLKSFDLQVIIFIERSKIHWIFIKAYPCSITKLGYGWLLDAGMYT